MDSLLRLKPSADSPHLPLHSLFLDTITPCLVILLFPEREVYAQLTSKAKEAMRLKKKANRSSLVNSYRGGISQDGLSLVHILTASETSISFPLSDFCTFHDIT